MTPAVFYAACIVLWGSSQWRAEARIALKVSERTFRRWLAGDELVPVGVVKELVSHMAAKRDAIEAVLKATVIE